MKQAGSMFSSECSAGDGGSERGAGTAGDSQVNVLFVCEESGDEHLSLLIVDRVSNKECLRL